MKWISEFFKTKVKKPLTEGSTLRRQTRNPPLAAYRPTPPPPPPMPRTKSPRISNEELRRLNPPLQDAFEQYEILLRIYGGETQKERSERLIKTSALASPNSWSVSKS